MRRFASTDQPAPPDPELNVPAYWIRPFQRLETAAGMHRFVWDLHGDPAGVKGEYDIAAILHDTPAPQGEWMPPGVYTVRLTVDGKALAQPLLVKPDPRR